MDRIDAISSVSSSETVSKRPQKDTPQGIVANKVTHVAPGTAGMMVPMTKPECSSNIQKPLSSSRQSDLKSDERLAIDTKSIPEWTGNPEQVLPSPLNPTVIEKTANPAQKQALPDKSTAASLSDHNRDCDFVLTIHPKSKWIIENMKKDELDFGPNNEKIFNYFSAMDRECLWMTSMLEKEENKHLIQKENRVTMPPEEKGAEFIKNFIAHVLINNEILFGIDAQDDEFLEIVKTFASFVQLNENNEKEMHQFIKDFTFHVNNAEKSIARGAADYKKIHNDFKENIRPLMSKYMPYLSLHSFDKQCKLVFELNNNGVDIINSFRNHLIKTNYMRI
jgi:hypothetical protein